MRSGRYRADAARQDATDAVAGASGSAARVEPPVEVAGDASGPAAGRLDQRDRGSRMRVVSRLQEAAGNAAVSRIVSDAPTLQRADEESREQPPAREKIDALCSAVHGAHVGTRWAPVVAILYPPILSVGTAAALHGASHLWSPNSAILKIARAYAMNSGGRAARHLQHFIDGSGADLDISDTLTDAGVAAKLERVIKNAVESDRRSGSVAIEQSDWAEGNLGENNLAIGAMNVEWAAKGSPGPGEPVEVTLSVRDLYRWHPTAGRITQCVHKAGQALLDEGAKRFWMVGKGTMTVTPSVEPSEGAK